MTVNEAKKNFTNVSHWLRHRSCLRVSVLPSPQQRVHTSAKSPAPIAPFKTVRKNTKNGFLERRKENLAVGFHSVFDALLLEEDEVGHAGDAIALAARHLRQRLRVQPQKLHVPVLAAQTRHRRRHLVARRIPRTKEMNNRLEQKKRKKKKKKKKKKLGEFAALFVAFLPDVLQRL
jgi:hypothetical protein